MTTQTLELQAVTNEELMAAAGGKGSHFVHRIDQADRNGATNLQSLG